LSEAADLILRKRQTACHVTSQVRSEVADSKVKVQLQISSNYFF
jgi:hypothetical protein